MCRVVFVALLLTSPFSPTSHAPNLPSPPIKHTQSHTPTAWPAPQLPSFIKTRASRPTFPHLCNSLHPLPFPEVLFPPGMLKEGLCMLIGEMSDWLGGWGDQCEWSNQFPCFSNKFSQKHGPELPAQSRDSLWDPFILKSHLEFYFPAITKPHLLWYENSVLNIPHLVTLVPGEDAPL